MTKADNFFYPRKSILQEKAAKEKLEKGKVSPKEMFLSQSDKFSAWDETGVPTLDIKGEKVNTIHSTFPTLYNCN